MVFIVSTQVEAPIEVKENAPTTFLLNILCNLSLLFRRRRL